MKNYFEIVDAKTNDIKIKYNFDDPVGIVCFALTIAGAVSVVKSIKNLFKGE